MPKYIFLAFPVVAVSKPTSFVLKHSFTLDGRRPSRTHAVTPQSALSTAGQSSRDPRLVEVYDVKRYQSSAQQSTPWAGEEYFAWNEFPRGHLARRVDYVLHDATNKRNKQDSHSVLNAVTNRPACEHLAIG